MKILLVGGSKSGKSHLAQRVTAALAAGGPMYYWATMIPTDGEDRERIRKHLEDREGWGFSTVERAKDLCGAPKLPADASVLFDSATAYLTNEMFGAFDPEKPFVPNENCAARCAAELGALASSVKHFVLAADDVFRDGFGFDETTELWRRALGEVLIRIADGFDCVVEVTAGVMRAVKGGLPPLAPDIKRG